MKKHPTRMRLIILRILLIISGLIAIGVGSEVLLRPEAFFAMNGVVLEDSASLLSEIRAPGGFLIAGGITIALGAFITEIRTGSLALSALIYLSYSTSRLWSMIVDGIPADTLVQATGLELLIGITCVIACVMHAIRA